MSYRDRQLNRKQTKQCGELYYRVQSYRRCVFEGIANRVADNRSIVQRRVFLFQIDFYNLLRVVPGAARIRHEDRLIQTKDRNRDQVTNEEEGINKSERESREEHSQEDIKHALLRILGADLHDLLTVFHRSFLNAFETNVRLDELNRAIGAGGNGLDRNSGKTVDHGAPGNQAENKWSMQKRKAIECR